ncbi:hypothetical protein CDD83_8855 [Cordyceps sp. RAO-2017]|nr:hypothetical protein CDD83_8855 [Cordyceps sp. RAO-2017]
MQTVPSLVGTGTAVAAAASGLVFGQHSPTAAATTTTSSATAASTASTTAAAAAAATAPPSATASEFSPAGQTQRRSHARTTSVDRVLDLHQRPNSLPCPRPATTSAAPSIGPEHSRHGTLPLSPVTSRPPLSRYQRPQSSQFTTPRAPARGVYFARQPELSPSGGIGDSVSSNGSWIRRLSIRPLSQQSSPRSSLIADSTSVTFSHSSAAPILGPSSPPPPSLPPNKLVKRPSSTQNNASPGDASPRWRPRAHLPSLRRPTTSHQRSATLQLFRAAVDVAGPTAHPKYSFEEPIWPEELLGASPFDARPRPDLQTHDPGWASFFHSRTATIATSGSLQSRLGDASPASRGSVVKRIRPEAGDCQYRAHLIKPIMMAPFSASADLSSAPSPVEDPPSRLSRQVLDNLAASASATTPLTRTRRSLSASLSSASNWVTKRSSSLRRSRRGSERPATGSQRHVSEPAAGGDSPPVTTQPQSTSSVPENPANVTRAPHAQQVLTPLQPPATIHRQRPVSESKSPSSPVPSLSSHSFAAHGGTDVLRAAGLARGGAATRYARPNQPSGSSTSSTVMSQFARVSHNERCSMMESSDGDARGFTSGDDDDMDFKSDTFFDSLRTLSSSRARAVETPLESVYDESPPSTAGNSRAKRLSVQEMLGRGWDEGNKIMEEEDETSLTPSRVNLHAGAKLTSSEHSVLIAEPRSSSDSSEGAVAPRSKTFEHSSLDDDLDEDEDWTRDDDAPFNNPLSHPSQGGSLGPRGMNPNVRLAMASLGGEAIAPTGTEAQRADRPMSTLFDWSEPPVHGKQEDWGNSLRPRTAYAMPEMDSRGGRSAIRKGPMPTHVRSQSVPVAHDCADISKPIGSKYGTWGMGTKTVSEDWDEDFEFGAGGIGSKDGTDGKSHEDAFAVPESIRATQPSVRAHSGQIRELSLLVNDLKRLCRHGRELNMLNGEQRVLWREAEGIIRLASPDEDDVNEYHAPPPADVSTLDIKGLSLESRHESPAPDQWDSTGDNPEPIKWRASVVRERYSPRRRSVFSPDDDIFGGSWPSAEDNSTQPRASSDRPNSSSDITVVVRSVMESMRQHHRSCAEPAREARQLDGTNGRVQFDTGSLKALVKKAGELRDTLSDIVRRADQITQSPAATPRHERRLDSSPAFTRVFDDPGSSPPRRAAKLRSNNSVIETTPSPEKPPSSSLGSQLPVMTVS